MKQKWIVRVFENDKHAYNEAFWTRKAAYAFIAKVTDSHVKWSCDLQRVGLPVGGMRFVKTF